MNRIMNYKFTLIVLLIILYTLFMPGDSVPSIPIEGIDKVIHFSMFFLLVCSYYFEFIILKNTLPRFIPVCLTIFIFGLSTELAQGLLTTSRANDPKDLLADSLGILLGALLMISLYKYSKRFLNLFYKLIYKKEIT